jgi:hypothetical protein
MHRRRFCHSYAAEGKPARFKGLLGTAAGGWYPKFHMPDFFRPGHCADGRLAVLSGRLKMFGVREREE